MKKQTIRLTENELHEVIKESVYTILEKNYKNFANKMKIAQYLNGKSKDEKKDEWDRFIAKNTAIQDINKDRNVLAMTPHERDFNNSITYKTFDTDFDVLNQDFYDGDYNFGM